MKFLKKLVWLTFWSIFVLAIVFAGWRLLSLLPSMGDYLSNVVTTTIGVIIGIPVALAINDYQRKIQSEEASRQIEIERYSRKILLLQYISEELELNKSLLKDSIEKQSSIKNYTTYIGLKSDLWLSLLSSGDLKYIDEAEILNSLSLSYFLINRIRDLEKVYYDTNFYMQTDNKDYYTGKRAVQAVEYLRPIAFDQVAQTHALISDYLAELSKENRSSD
jgi:hypothetical protein